MKKEFLIPKIKINKFECDIYAAAAVSSINGVDLTEQALKEQQIKNIQKSALNVLEFVQ